MKTGFFRKVLFGGMALSLFCNTALAGSKCPTPSEIDPKIQKLTQGNFHVSAVNESQVPSLCEVVVESRQGGMKNIIYYNPDKNVLILGNMINPDTGENLTYKRLVSLNKLTKQQMEQLKELAVFKQGKGPEVFLFVDPFCPFCKRMEQVLMDYADQGLLTVYVLMFPLENIHPGATEAAVDIACNTPNLKALHDYKKKEKVEVDENCRKEAEEKIRKTVELANQLGVRGTPTVVFPDGRMISGFPPESFHDILTETGLKVEKPSKSKSQ